MLKEPAEGARVLLHLGVGKPRGELDSDNGEGFCLYNPRLETVKEYVEAFFWCCTNITLCPCCSARGYGNFRGT